MAPSARSASRWRPMRVLDLSALNAVTSYEPNELIITVQAGAPLADVQSLINSKNQQFAFEPMDTSALLGVSGNGTIGGMIGAGLAGPRRIKAGGARDHLLGAHAVSGFGDSFKTGGQGGEERHRLRSLQAAGGVVGHARGDDGSDAEGDAEARERAHAGAARARRCHREPGDDRGARLALRRVGRGASAEFGVRLRGRRAGAPRGAGRALTLLRLEGIAASVAHRAGSLGKALAPFGAVEMLQDDASAAVWAAIRDVEPFAAGGALGAWPVWRIVCPPASGGALGQALARETGGDVIYDWGGGLIWAALPPKPDAQAASGAPARRRRRRPRRR